ncbi:E3 SUMO-protein ligase MMS21 isoform X1 [Coffea eugenioides]|uniref:E3 SUMO-protein ligase MMS21 isoform X1 n=1 Tax=Coffea eugenioides TaxID=49369 RepID=UPI000F60D677|nr:E3 SUMO-protein ligase MMS21 isoform X1 [Coffea eugenioides]
MASTSAPHRSNAGGYSRMKSAASKLYNDNQSLIAEMRRAFNMMKEIAVDLEKDKKSDLVKELESGVAELLEASDDCMHLSTAILSVGNEYQPRQEQLTDFKKLLDDEITKSKSTSSSTSQNHQFLRQFREAVWNVHHSGIPMPGEEQEDIVMTSTESNILNKTCPVTGKPVTELADPVRSMDCKHVYDKNAIMYHMRSMKSKCPCPVAGCPKELQVHRLICDPLLLVEIEEMRTMSKGTAQPGVIEDFTG